MVSALPQLLMLSELVDRRSVTPAPLGLSCTTENKIILNFSDPNLLLFGIPVRVRQKHVCVGAPDPAIFVSDLQYGLKLFIFLFTFFVFYFLKLHLHNFSKMKSHKEVTKQRFFLLVLRFCLMIVKSGVGSIPRANGSGRPKDILILEIRIRLRNPDPQHR
jgi:hypothetical protein